ncbi:uncharacterized protein LOC110943892 [Helianthus annuus]|uniref:uncharacterized protein LOC110943892 n=1 Tax=Helianthus annuus TaxID=4232 RepID=UPI000B8F5C38|nr:uncharacterized protein LOC110943892 [Helianthus annuus]
MESLHCMISKAVELREFEGIRVDNGVAALSHLFYADDAIIMGVWSEENINKVARVLRVFHLCSGLKIYIHKSHLFGIGVNEGEVVSMASVLGYRVGSIPFEYLGIRVGANMNRVCHWNSVVEAIQNRLSTWKANTLSMGGRLTLLKSVLSSIPIYYLSLYKAPVKVIDKIESMMKKILWAGSSNGNKVYWVAWETVCTTKKDGGLGVSRLKDVNAALIAKWVWRFKVEKDALWRNVVEQIHEGRGNWDMLPVKRGISGCWKTIVNFVENMKIQGMQIQQLVRCKVGSGESARFWTDLWIGSEVLKKRWPCLYKHDSNKGYAINERIRWIADGIQFTAQWRRFPVSVEAISEMQDMDRLLNTFAAWGLADSWVWNDGKDGTFSVANFKKLLRQDRGVSRESKLKWDKWVLLKVNLVVWRAELVTNQGCAY